MINCYSSGTLHAHTIQATSAPLNLNLTEEWMIGMIIDGENRQRKIEKDNFFTRSASLLAREYGVSRVTIYRWRKREQ
jgi:hypothetical protein